jgi:Recombinase
VSTGEREIEPAEAAVVERIFREFVSGRSPKQIANSLNARNAGAEHYIAQPHNNDNVRGSICKAASARRGSVARTRTERAFHDQERATFQIVSAVSC